MARTEKERPKDRTLEDNLKDDQETAAAVEAHDLALLRLRRYEEEVHNNQGSSLQKLMALEEENLSSQDREHLTATLSKVRRRTYQLQEAIDEHYEAMKKEKKALSDKLDALYHERQALVPLETDKRKRKDEQSNG